MKRPNTKKVLRLHFSQRNYSEIKIPEQLQKKKKGFELKEKDVDEPEPVNKFSTRAIGLAEGRFN